MICFVAHCCKHGLQIRAIGFENDFLTVQTGDHHLLANYVFINEPVEPIIEEDKVIYKREIYVPKS